VGASGTAELDFGAFPGVSDALVTVTGQVAIIAGSLVEAWVRPVDTTDHTADEHMVETFRVFAHTIVAGTGFTISGFNTSQVNEPLEPILGNTGAIAPGATEPQGFQRPSAGGIGTRIWGKWTIAWVWN